MGVSFLYEGRVLLFDSRPHELCDCRCHRFPDRPNCLRWSEPCCYRCHLCGELIKKGMYGQHYQRHLEDNRIKGWEAMTISVDLTKGRTGKV